MLFISAECEPPAPEIRGDWRVGESLIRVAGWLSAARMCITLVNGVGHLAAALDANIVRVQENVPRCFADFPTRGFYRVVEKRGGVEAVTAADIIRAAEEGLCD
jgi:hypothetical protein